MKQKLLKALAGLGVIKLIVIGLMILCYFAKKLFTLDFNTLNLVIALGFAPFYEELFFRRLFIKIGERFKIMEIACGVSCFLFVWWHVGNYPYAGWYFAALIQGTMGLACWYVANRFSIFHAMALHFQYNFALYLLNW